MPYKLRKVSHHDPNHFHRNLIVLFLALAGLFSSLIPVSVVAEATHPQGPVTPDSAKEHKAPAPTVSTDDCLLEPSHDALILRSMGHLFKMDYALAEAGFDSLPEIPAKAYFRGLVWVNRFNDLGDTAALFQAERLWERLDQNKHPDKNYLFYQGLTELQLSYVANVTGRNLKAARLGRKAVSSLKPFAGKAEAEAALALYNYYKATLLKHVDWLPFVSSNPKESLAKLELHLPKSRYLKEIIQTSLLWLYYDGQQYKQGLILIESFLQIYPKNRLYRQIQADFKFRQGEIVSALEIQKTLNQEYLAMRKAKGTSKYLPIGYLSSVGNLAKIYASQKQPALLQGQISIWQTPEFKATMNWLPASLKREVDSLKTR